MKAYKISVWILVFLILFALVGCSSAGGSSSENAKADDTLVKEEITADTENTFSDLPENRKLIQTVNMAVETEDLDAVLAQIESRIAEFQGYVESSNVQNGSRYSNRRFRSASLTVRIPADSLESFMGKVSEISNVVSSQKTVEDITLSYVATESRMKALQTEEARLLELLAQAATMDDLLTVEKRLTEVRTELERVTSSLRVFDNQVNYATVHLNVEEVTEYTDVTKAENVWQRIGSGFKKSLKGLGDFFVELFVFLIVASPYLVVAAVIVFVVIMVMRLRYRKKVKKNKEEDKKE